MLHCTGNGACWMSLVNCHTNLMRLGLHLSHVNISADTLCFWHSHVLCLFKKSYCYVQDKKKKKKKWNLQNACYAFSPPLSLLLSASPSLHRSLSSINDRTWETCASSNVWLHFSFCWQSKGSERDSPATLLHLPCCYPYLHPQKNSQQKEKKHDSCWTGTHILHNLLG